MVTDEELRELDVEVHRKVFDPSRVRQAPVYYCPEGSGPLLAPAGWLERGTLGTHLDWSCLPDFESIDAKDFLWRVLPRYTTDIRAAWLVVERFANHSCIVKRFADKRGYVARFCWCGADAPSAPGPSWQAEAESAPLAICKAALQVTAAPAPDSPR